jgi:hypothetical protein
MADYENPSAGKFDPPSTAAARDRRIFPSPSRLWLLPLALVPLAVIFLSERPGGGARSRVALPAVWFAGAIVRYAVSRRKRHDRDEDSSSTTVTR